MNKIVKLLIAASIATATASFAGQRFLSFAPIEGFASSDENMINFTVQGQVAKEMFDRLRPSVAHEKNDTVCNPGETKVNKTVICDVDKNKNYTCWFSVSLNDKINITYNDDPAAPYECQADPAVKNYTPAQKEAKKNGYWRQQN